MCDIWYGGLTVQTVYFSFREGFTYRYACHIQTRTSWVENRNERITELPTSVCNSRDVYRTYSDKVCGLSSDLRAYKSIQILHVIRTFLQLSYVLNRHRKMTHELARGSTIYDAELRWNICNQPIIWWYYWFLYWMYSIMLRFSSIILLNF